MIDFRTIQAQAELYLFRLMDFMKQIYEPWMALAMGAILIIIMLGLIGSVIMWIFNDKLRWYHRMFYWLPVIKLIGTQQFRRGHRTGAEWGLGEGYILGSGGKKLKQRKIARALIKAGI